MKNSKRLVAFLVAMSTAGMNVPMALADKIPMVAYAEENSAEAITINAQPEDATVAKKTEAFFSVDAIGNDLTYLWQYQYSGTDTWTDWKSKTTPTIGVGYSADRNGMKLRCRITDAAGNTKYTDEATLTYGVASSIQIVTQPQNTTVARKTEAIFTVEATGNELTYLWQYQYSGTDTWTDWKSKTTPTIGVGYSADRDGMKLRCRITDAGGSTKYTNAATLTYGVDSSIQIVTQPQDATVARKTEAVFSVEATGNELTYLWQYQYSGTDTWTDWKSKTTPTIGVGYSADRDGMKLRCRITDATGSIKYTDEVTITYGVVSSIQIVSQPQNATVAKKTEAIFAVEATGNELTYLWQYQYSGTDTWTDWKTKTTPSIGVGYSADREGMKLRCRITDAGGSTMYTDEVTLTYVNALTVRSPESATIPPNGSATFTVSSNGNGLTYVWEQSTDGRTWTSYTGAGAAAASITVSGAEASSGTQYRCTVSDAYGQTVVSEPATLTIEAQEVVIPNTTKEIVITAGEPYQLDLVGKGLKYYSNNDEVKVDTNGVITSNEEWSSAFVFVLDASGNKCLYRVFVVPENDVLAIDEPYYSIEPERLLKIQTNKDAEFIISDNEKAALYYYEDYSSSYCEFCGYIPGSYDVIAYTYYGEMDAATVNVEGDIIDAALDTEYSGIISENSNVWYRYVNNTNEVQPITFDVTGVEYNENEENEIIDAFYGIYATGFYAEPHWRGGTELAAELIYLNPGEELYIRPQMNDAMTSSYDFSIIISNISTVEYTLGSEVDDVVLDAKNLTKYAFSVSETGVYEMEAASVSPFAWEIRNADNEVIKAGYSEYINEYSARAVLTLQAGNYTICFKPEYVSETGPLTFTFGEYENANMLSLNVVTPGIFTNSEVFDVFTFIAPHAGKYSFESLTSYDTYGHLYSDADLTEELASDDDSGNGNNFKITITLDEGQTVYLKARPYSGDSTAEYEVIAREFVCTKKSLELDTPVTGSYINYDAYDFFEFTAPSSGDYIFRSYDANANLIGTLYSDQLLNEQLKYDDYSLGNGNFKFEYSLAEGQTVYLYPRNAYSSESADYTVVVRKRGRMDAVAVNGKTYENQFIPLDSDVWYEFTAPIEGQRYDTSSGYEYQFRFVSSDNSLNARAYYIDENGNYREKSYNGYESIYSTTDGTITLRLSQGETVYIKTSAYSAYYPYNEVNFTLSVSGGPYTQGEVNIPEEYYSGSSDIYTSGAFGWIKINNPNQNLYNLTITGTEGLEYDDPTYINLMIKLYSADGRLVASGTSEQNVVTFENPFDEADGCTEYYLYVEELDYCWIGNINVSYEPVIVQEGAEDDDVCPECGHANGGHYEDCSQFGSYFDLDE